VKGGCYKGLGGEKEKKLSLEDASFFKNIKRSEGMEHSETGDLNQKGGFQKGKKEEEEGVLFQLRSKGGRHPFERGE